MVTVFGSLAYWSFVSKDDLLFAPRQLRDALSPFLSGPRLDAAVASLASVAKYSRLNKAAAYAMVVIMALNAAAALLLLKRPYQFPKSLLIDEPPTGATPDRSGQNEV